MNLLLILNILIFVFAIIFRLPNPYLLIFVCPSLYVLTNSMAYGIRRFMPHSQGLSNNPYPEPNQSNNQFFVLTRISLRFILILSSH